MVGTLLFWPAYFAMDLSKAEEVELNALRDRAETLQRIASQKNCNVRYSAPAPPAPQQPESEAE